MEQLNEILSVISDFVWGVPMSSILLVTGIFLTTRLLFVQFRGFAHGVAITSGTYDDPDHKGQLTHFQALSAALSATIGIGNIGGVAIGIYFGGPGAIFWMWVSALFGMAIKFSECTLAIKYRKVEKDGNILGGPMYFIELGLHRYFKPLAYMFAFCTAFAALGSGNMVQSNTVADSLVNVLKVGYRTVVRSQIESAELNTLAEQYNASLETTATVNTRKLEYLGMETSAAANHGRDWPTIEHIRTEITTSNELLTTLGENTQGYRDRLKKMRFVSADLGNDELKFYPEGTVPAGVETDGRIWRLRVVNDPFSNTEINLVDIGPVGTWRWIIGIVIAGLVGVVIIGGIKRIGHVASYLVPIMSVVYVLSAILVLFLHLDKIGPAFQLIFHHAFNPTAAVGGSAAGVTIWTTITWGLRRGLFSNESGQGSAAMAHSTAKVEEPVREGLVAMLGPFIDTIVICTLTALVIITSGVWDCGLNSAPLTMAAFDKSLPVYGKWMVVIGIMLFAYSTVLSWSYYGEKGIEYLLGKWAKMPYKYAYVLFTLLGARLDLVAVWSYADTANGLMAIPNLVALLLLSGVIVRMTRKYMDEKKQGIHIPYKKLMEQKQKRPPQ